MYIDQTESQLLKTIMDGAIRPFANTFTAIQCKTEMLRAPKIHIQTHKILDSKEDIIGKDSQNESLCRQRPLSESSMDSEESYSIVFEDESDTDYASDTDCSESNSGEAESGLKNIASKVKFNLKPVVHMMIYWDYAYRAARKGPWEEVARDRVRFRGRVKRIENILQPILTNQHRSYIWKERFSKDD
ncbi:uncharacterized protein PPP1R15 [Prorops nasuta]|uniref:uncharacterized protein PPP1R15 n=1 Tax=Prorops nasuta TaxID=863751 RepID=UPI0034D020B1